MVFHNGYEGNYETALYLVEYEPFRKHGERNPLFNDTSRIILNLKEGQAPAVAHFFAILNERIAPNVPIVIVPSHDPNKAVHGIAVLAQELAAAGRVDATGCLRRAVLIDKQAGGSGGRSADTHLNSIEVGCVDLILGQNVLLLDDVTTTGASLQACSDLLIGAGAAKVQRFALGQSV